MCAFESGIPVILTRYSLARHQMQGTVCVLSAGLETSRKMVIFL